MVIELKKIDFNDSSISDSIDQHKLDEQIRVLEEYLNVIQMKNFKLPDTETDARKFYLHQKQKCMLNRSH